MKGNTNIKGSPLVIPDVDFCPCCGQWWVATNRNGERFDKKEAKPQLHQVLFDGEAPIQNKLLWQCNRCGGAHIHQDAPVDNAPVSA